MSPQPAEQSLSEFLRTRSEDILLAWDEFAAKAQGDAQLNARALRDHAAELLDSIADDMELPQTAAQQRAKSRGESRRSSHQDSAAQTHADTRMRAGFDVVAMMTEYRALRASVLHLWSQSRPKPTSSEILQLTRFNEALDQAIVESVTRYTERTKESTDLFIGVLGHDIRNPLSTIAMGMQLLIRKGRLDEPAARPILHSVERIKGVIEHIVDFSRAQAGQPMPITCTEGDLAAHADAIADETRVRHPDVAVRVERDEGDFTGCWDKGRIGQLLSNLLGNAVQYGDRARPITVLLAATPDAVRMEVRNHGPVIPPAECARIFEPLTRGSAASERHEQSGLGLGLYICREIVQAHGGRIEARSDPAEGTRFIVQLPRSPDARPRQ